MGFKCGIVGLPNVGKSTLFNALTQTAAAQAANYPFCTIEPNVGEVAVPDPRLDVLSKLAKSQQIIPTRLTFVDIAGQLPFDPDLFLDAVHTSYAGTRMRGWITLNALIPLIEKHLADKSWPRPMPNPQPPLPTITPRKVTLDCRA